MPALTTKRLNPIERKRRTHVKSRNGCGNCKLRRVKCDEIHPQCKTCTSYGVACDFAMFTSSLQLLAQGSFQIELTDLNLAKHKTSTYSSPNQRAFQSCQSDAQRSKENDDVEKKLREALPYLFTERKPALLSPISNNYTVATYINNSLLSAGSPGLDIAYKNSFTSPTPQQIFSEAHLEILSRFQTRTSLTIGDKRMAPAFRDVACQLAFTNPFLMEMLLGLTLMHDADLSLSHSPTLFARQKHASLQHWAIATKLFNQILSCPIPPSHRDAIWATGVHLGAASFWYTESTDPYQAWPLKPDDPSDLAWMRLGEGKRHLWRVADPTRPDSAFSAVMKYRPCLSPPDWMTSNDISLVPPRVKTLFNISADAPTTMTKNAYHIPVLILSRIQHMRLRHENVLHFLYVTAFATPEFLRLLEEKHVKAVFVVGWWFKVLADGELWWMARRAKIEGEAIRIWLGRRDGELAGLLDELVPRLRGLMDGVGMDEIGACERVSGIQ